MKARSMNVDVSAGVWLAMAYVVGAFPCGFLIARLKGIRDIREHGSGNSGATNVARALGIKWFFMIFFLDACKAYAVLALMQHHGAHERMLFDAAILLLFGNAYSVFLNFSGGKGVATSLGILAALAPAVALATLVVWGLFFAITRTVGKASIAALAILPLTFLLVCGQFSLYFALACFMAIWTVVRHRDNLKSYALKRA